MSYLLNPRLVPLLRYPHANSLIHPPRPHDNTNDIVVLLRLQRRFPLASMQPFGIHVLQQLRPDAVRQIPLEKTEGCRNDLCRL